MPPIRVYADTSVYGGVFDAEFAAHSRRFFDQVRQGRFRLVASGQVEVELMPAPESVRSLWLSLTEIVEFARVSPDARSLQGAYLDAGIVSDRSTVDALHVALATVSNCAALVSWNYKHIVHRDKAPRYNAVNMLRGAPTIGIYTPSEVVQYEEGL